MKDKNLKVTQSTRDTWDQAIDEMLKSLGLTIVYGTKTGSSVTMYPKQSKEQESLNKSANINKKSEKNYN